MDFSTAVIMQWIADLMLPFMRIGGMFVTMVGLSARTMPNQVRVLLSLCLTLVIMPVITPVKVPDLFSLTGFLMVAQQLLIGIAIGFISMMLLNTFVLAGQIVAMQTGLGFASIVDPVNGINVPAVGQFYLILATLIFWAVDGHLAMISMIVMSFEALPITPDWWEAVNYKEVAYWVRWVFITALIMSLAPIVSLLIINLSFGVATKAAPQLNIFSIGFAISQLVGIFIIWIMMSNFMVFFEAQWARAQQTMCQLLHVCQ